MAKRQQDRAKQFRIFADDPRDIAICSTEVIAEKRKLIVDTLSSFFGDAAAIGSTAAQTPLGQYKPTSIIFVTPVANVTPLDFLAEYNLSRIKLIDVGTWHPAVLRIGDTELRRNLGLTPCCFLKACVPGAEKSCTALDAYYQAKRAMSQPTPMEGAGTFRRAREAQRENDRAAKLAKQDAARSLVASRASQSQHCRAWRFGCCPKDAADCRHGNMEETKKIKCISARKPGEQGYKANLHCSFAKDSCPYEGHVSGLLDMD